MAKSNGTTFYRAIGIWEDLSNWPFQQTTGSDYYGLKWAGSYYVSSESVNGTANDLNVAALDNLWHVWDLLVPYNDHAVLYRDGIRVASTINHMGAYEGKLVIVDGDTGGDIQPLDVQWVQLFHGFE